MNRSLISHLGIAVKDLNAAIEKYRLITGIENISRHHVKDQKVEVAIFSDKNNSGSRIELVTPTENSSPIARFLDKKGEGLHHICLFVEDIELKLLELKKAGVKLIDETPKIGAEGNKIAFVHPSDFSGVLIELEELPKEK